LGCLAKCHFLAKLHFFFIISTNSLFLPRKHFSHLNLNLFMKQIFNTFVLLLVCCFGTFGLLSAQGTAGSGVVVELTYNGGSAKFTEVTCNFGGVSGWGGAFSADFCAPVVWAKDLVGNDSLACDSIAAGSLAGKVVVIRRGACEFGRKALNAEKAGAVAVIIVNHFANAADNGCTVLNMGAGAVGSQVTIPLLGGARDMGITLDNAIKAGNAEVCFRLPTMTAPTVAYQYATPVSQVDSLGAMSVTFINRSAADVTGLVLKADIKQPDGTRQSVSLPIDRVAAGADTFAIFPPFLPKNVKGKFDVTFSNNKFTTSRDSVRRSFEHTDYTFAVDNLVIDPLGVGLTNQQFADAGFSTQNAGLYWTGRTGGKATYATFGLSNVDSLYVPDNPEANQILVYIYDADADDDGVGDLNESFADLTDGLIGTAVYEMNGNEGVDSLLNVQLTDVVNGDNVIDLKPNHPYYVSLLYDGTLAGTSRCLRFSNTLQEEYLVVGGLLATPLFTNLDGGTLYSGWAGATVIQRMQLEGFNPIVNTKTPQLDASKISITPNPAVDFINVNLKLAETSNVGITLIDWAGRSVRTIAQRDFQTGTLQVDTKSLPSGTYMMWVRTREGYRVEKVAVCH
jgi:hypothetical protein